MHANSIFRTNTRELCIVVRHKAPSYHSSILGVLGIGRESKEISSKFHFPNGESGVLSRSDARKTRNEVSYDGDGIKDFGKRYRGAAYCIASYS